MRLYVYIYIHILIAYHISHMIEFLDDMMECFFATTRSQGWNRLET